MSQLIGKKGEKLVEATPEALLGLLNPVVAMPNSEEVLASAPLLQLMTTHIEPVLQN